MLSIQAEYDQYKSFPSEPKVPVSENCEGIFFEYSDLLECLENEVNISSVSTILKDKIRLNQNFYSFGLLSLEHDKNHCPFCTQTLNDLALATIQKYEQYFADEEAKAINTLKSITSIIQQKTETIEDFKTTLLQNIIKYDDLKKYFSKIKNQELLDSSASLDLLVTQYNKIIALIEAKISSLGTKKSIDNLQKIKTLEQTILSDTSKNAELILILDEAIKNLDDERKSIQRRACSAFDSDFYNKHKTLANNILELKTKLGVLSAEIANLEKNYGEKVKARNKVSETFTILLSFIFGEKYTFDDSDFTVKRNKQDMTRGGDRTLSDGEKSVLAFCYFIAQTHLKVETVDCYEKLFFVIDDPVSSLSFDYIYSIAQILKGLQIKGSEISLKQAPNPRPKLLILTHNDYLYNIARTNNIIKPNSIFQLIADNSKNHRIVSLQTFLTPHTLHLKHVREVSEGTVQPDHSTANCIRSVIESIWRFCRPDCNDLADFIGIANNEIGITTKSLLIHDLSHGGKFVINPPVYTDIKTAADDALAIVDHFASGQITSITT